MAARQLGKVRQQVFKMSMRQRFGRWLTNNLITADNYISANAHDTPCLLWVLRSRDSVPTVP